MKTLKITQALILVSIIATILVLVRGDFMGKMGLLYLIWNLFLAWVPYIISLYFIKKDTSIKYFILLFILWLLFFPNAPYLVTDVLHIAGRSQSLIWFDSLLFFFFGWLGLLLGMLSLYHIHQYFKAHVSYLSSEFIIFGICFISSFGIYLGRFERWNSWDLFVNPFPLIKHSLNLSANMTHTGTPLIFVVVFTVFMYSVYKTMYILVEKN